MFSGTTKDYGIFATFKFQCKKTIESRNHMKQLKVVEDLYVSWSADFPWDGERENFKIKEFRK